MCLGVGTYRWGEGVWGVVFVCVRRYIHCVGVGAYMMWVWVHTHHTHTLFIPHPLKNKHTAADKHTTPKKPTLQLTTNLPPAAGGPVTHNVSNMASSRPTPLGQCHIGTALGKSALQKNIRLGRAGEAVRCSVQLVKDDVDAFIRRASIICLEVVCRGGVCGGVCGGGRA